MVVPHEQFLYPKDSRFRDGNSIGRRWCALGSVSTEYQSDDHNRARSDGCGNCQSLAVTPLLLPEHEKPAHARGASCRVINSRIGKRDLSDAEDRFEQWIAQQHQRRVLAGETAPSGPFPDDKFLRDLAQSADVWPMFSPL